MKIALGTRCCEPARRVGAKRGGIGDAASRAWMEVSERPCPVAFWKGSMTRSGPVRTWIRFQSRVERLSQRIECDDGEDGILSAVMCLPTAPGSMGSSVARNLFSGVDTPLEPPSGTFGRPTGDEPRGLHSPGLWKHIACAFTAHQEEVG